MSDYPGMPQRYQMALDKLAAYNLQRPQRQGSDIGESIGGGISRMVHRKPEPKKQASTHSPEMYDKYVAGTGAMAGLDHEGQREHTNQADNQAILTAADNSVRVNQMAEDARLGGSFTPNGLEKASKEAEANGYDRMQLRRMVGLAGTQVPGVTPPPMAPSAGPGKF